MIIFNAFIFPQTMKSLHFLYLIIALSLISCANLPSKNIPQTFDQNDSQGLIIGAFAIKNEKPIFNGYGLYHTSTDFSEKISVANRLWFVPEQMVKMKLKPDFFDGDKGVYYFAFKKDPGNYTFNILNMFENGGMYSGNANLQFDIPFKAEKGKITYVGEIYLDYRASSVTRDFLRERDLTKLKEKFPSLNWSQLQQ